MIAYRRRGAGTSRVYLFLMELVPNYELLLLNPEGTERVLILICRQALRLLHGRAASMEGGERAHERAALAQPWVGSTQCNVNHRLDLRRASPRPKFNARQLGMAPSESTREFMRGLRVSLIPRYSRGRRHPLIWFPDRNFGTCADG